MSFTLRIPSPLAENETSMIRFYFTRTHSYSTFLILFVNFVKKKKKKRVTWREIVTRANKD